MLKEVMFLQYFREEGIEVKKVTIHFLRRQCYIKRSNKNVKEKGIQDDFWNLIKYLEVLFIDWEEGC